MADVKQLIMDIVCKEAKDARKLLTDKLWKCKSGALDKVMLTRELLAIAAADPDRPSTCQPLADVGRSLPSAGGGGGGGDVPAGGGMDTNDVPCTRESIDRIFQQILCREPSSKEAFGRMWQCKNGKLGDRKLTNMLTHFVVTGREKREPTCGPLPGVARVPGGIGAPPLMAPPMGGGGGAIGGGGLGVLGGGAMGGGGGGGMPMRPSAPVTLQRPAQAAADDPLSPDECPNVVFEAFKRILCRDPNTAEKTAAVWRCRKHSESRDRVFASLAFLSRKFSVVSECPGGAYGE